MKTKTKTKQRPIEPESESESESDFEEEPVVVGQIPTINVPRHIKKRALKNKSLSVSFSEKDLNDFVTGFHKRKKKRRKEAQKQLKEKERLKRIQLRKRRKEEKELALYGGAVRAPAAPELEPDEPGSDGGEDEQQTIAPIAETKTYQSDVTTITVITSELNREDDDLRPVRPVPTQSNVVEKNHSLAVKKKPFKVVRRHKPQRKARKAASGKEDRKKSKNKR